MRWVPVNTCVVSAGLPIRFMCRYWLQAATQDKILTASDLALLLLEQMRPFYLQGDFDRGQAACKTNVTVLSSMVKIALNGSRPVLHSAAVDSTHVSDAHYQLPLHEVFTLSTVVPAGCQVAQARKKPLPFWACCSCQSLHKCWGTSRCTCSSK